MFNSFNPNTKYSNGGNLIPNGTLAFAVVNIDKTQHSQNSGGLLASLSLTIAYGPFENRKVFHYLGDPSDERHSEKYRQMSLGALQAMLEVAGVFDPARPETYAQFANASFVDILSAIDGKLVAIKVGIEKGQDGYDDKNKVADWLTPNPVSRSHKKFNELAQSPQKCIVPAEKPAPGAGTPWGNAQPASSVAPSAAAAPAAQPAAAPGTQAPSWLTGNR